MSGGLRDTGSGLRTTLRSVQQSLTGPTQTLGNAPTFGDMRLITHLPEDPFNTETRVALCGAEIANIPAFGSYESCAVCDELWDQYFPEVPHD